jgi:hypothetical protein
MMKNRLTKLKPRTASSINRESIMLRIIPPFMSTKPEVLDLIARNGAVYVEADRLYKMWPYLDTGTIAVVSLAPPELAILSRFMDTLMVEPPVVVTGVPGAFYSSEWNMLSAHLTNEPYSTLEQSLMKSGFTSHSTEQAVIRGRHAVEDPSAHLRQQAQAETKRAFATTPAHQLEVDDEDLDPLV